MSGYKTHRLSQEPDDFDGPWPEENAMTKPTVDEVLVLVKDYACKSFMGPDGGLKEAHDKMMAAIEALASHKTDRWNIDEMSDGSLSVCKGEHAGSDPCEPVLYVPAPVAAAPASREEMATFAAELKADPAKAQRFFQGAGILDASGNLTPQYGGPVAWRIFDGEGGYDYLSDGPTDEQSAWGERWGRKYEPLYLHPSRANDETLKWQLIGSELLAQDMHKRIEQLKLQSAAAELVHRETATTVLTQMAEIERLRPDAQRYRYVVHTAPRSKIVPLFESGYTDAEIEALIDKMRSEQ